MKKLFILFSFMFCVSGWGQTIPDGFILYDKTMPGNNEVELGLALAKQQILIGAAKLNLYAQEFGQKVIQRLETVNFYIPKFRESLNLCQDKEIFVWAGIFDRIFLCNKFTTGLLNSIKSVGTRTTIQLISQSIIHEGVHLAQVSDECVAVEFEIKILAANNIRLISPVSKEKYKNICDFSWADKYLPSLQEFNSHVSGK